MSHVALRSPKSRVSIQWIAAHLLLGSQLACQPATETEKAPPVVKVLFDSKTADNPATTSEPVATPDAVKAFFAGQGKTVLVFTGYSGSGYQDESGMLSEAAEILDRFDPDSTIVSIGATVDGIGAVYELAKTRGYTTAGIVSTQARQYDAEISPHADHVFFIEDATWGGLLEGSDELSPTSRAMVEAGDVFVGIGGGAVSRDELVAALQLGKQVEIIAAEMNHQKALDKAERKGQPPPTDFLGPVHAHFARVAEAESSRD